MEPFKSSCLQKHEPDSDRIKEPSVSHLPGLGPRPDAAPVRRPRSARSEHRLDEPGSCLGPGSCTSSGCRTSAGWRWRRVRPLCERSSPAVGRRTAAEKWRDTTSSASWRSPSTTARASAAALRSIRSSRSSGAVWRGGRVCYRSW